MAKSQPTRDLDAILQDLKPLLKERGFRVRVRTFNRATSDALTQVVQFQMGSFQPPGAQEIPGLRPNLYGRFTVNLGVYVPEVARYGAGEAGTFVPEYACCIRTRLGAIGCRQGDVWWETWGDQQLEAEIRVRLERDGFPFLARFETRDAILTQLSDAPSPGPASTPPRITCAIILAERGRTAEARELLNAQANEARDARHSRYIRELAERLGVSGVGS